MRILGFTAHDAFVFSNLTCRLNHGVTVVTGQNGTGKTSLGRIIDVIRLGLQSVGSGDRHALEANYGTAGRNGTACFSVGLRVSFDDDDRRVIDDFLRASLVSSMTLNQDMATMRRRRLVLDTEDIGVGDLFGEGSFVVEHNDVSRNPWRVAWVSLTSQATGEPGMLLRLDTNMLSPDDGSSATGGAPQLESLVDAFITEAQTAAHMQSGSGMPLPENFRFPTVVELGRRGPIMLVARPTSEDPEPEPVRRLLAWLAIDPSGPARVVGFAEIALNLLNASVFVTANQRSPIETRWGSGFLALTPDLTAGRDLALALHQDKNGDATARERFEQTSQVFERLTSPGLALNVTARELTDAGDAASTTILEPVVNDGGADIPLALSGAGRIEAAQLAAVLAHRWQSLVLDEPATNLSASAQRQVVDVIRDRTRNGLQTVLVTHSGHLVPADTVEDLKSLVRLARHGEEVRVHRPSDDDLLERSRTLLRPVDVRDALFADGVLLTEGGTEYELLRVWLSRDADPTLEAANVALLPVGGDTGFVPHMRLMDELGVAWAALVDGPALQVRLPRYLAEPDQAPVDDFEVAKQFWQDRGVQTLARQFGTGEQQGDGEVEVFMQSHDPDAFEQARTSSRRSKIHLGAAYAAIVEMPGEVDDVWVAVISALGRR